MKLYYQPPEYRLGRYLSSWLSVLLVILCLPASAHFYPETTLDTRISNEKKISLKDALSEIAERHNINLNYNAKQIADLSVSTTIARKKYHSPEAALHAVLNAAGLEYKKIGDTDYVIRAMKEPFSEMVPSRLLAYQGGGGILVQITVSGTVQDENNNGLPGVNVLEKNTSNGTITDIDGKFSLSVEGEASTLVFSSIGYITQEIPVGNVQDFSIQMQTDTRQLSEVVVTALGITREQKSLGYSVGEISGEEMSRVPQENILNSIAGKVSGVQIQSTSGDPGSSVSMVIRGATSLNGDNQPLFVIDGVPVNNTLNNVTEFGSRNEVDWGNAISDLNPDDIADISVLKGPSAAALYGSRAGNGVVLITTKSGKNSQGFGVSINSNTVMDIPFRYLPFHSNFAAGQREGILDEGSAYWAGPELDVGNTAPIWNSNGEAVPLESHPDNAKNFLENGLTTTNNIGITNAYDRGSFRLSYTNMFNDGVIPGTNLKRNTVNLSSSYNIAPTLTVSTNINVGQTSSDNRPANDRGANPLNALYSVPQHIDIRDLENFWVPGQEGVQQLSYSDGANNPYFLAHALQNSFFRNRAFGNIILEWQITPSFRLMGRTALDRFSEERETRIPYSYNRNRRGAYGLQNLYRQETNTDFLATYEKEVGQFSLTVSGGGNIMRQEGSALTNETRELAIPGLFTIGNAAPGSIQAISTRFDKAIYSIYGLANIGFREMVFLDLTARNDWSSTLPAANRSYFYPSASLSLLLDNMLQLPDFVTMAKLRAGWAQVGNDTDPYRLEPVLSVLPDWGDVKRLGVPSTLLNAELKPEIATSFEIGTDLMLFEDRLRFDITYYELDNENQILGIRLPNSSGYSAKQINAGLVSSRGWDISVGVTPLNGPLRWDMNFNFTRNRTTIEELSDGIEYFQLWSEGKARALTFVGQQIGDIWDRDYVRVEDESSPYFGWPLLSNDGYLQDRSGIDDLVKIGNFNNDFTLGIQNAISYGRFTLNATIDWRQGGEFYSRTYTYGESDYKSQRYLDNFIQYDDPANLPELLKSNPEEYIIGVDNRVGGSTPERGGFEFSEDSEFFPGTDGAFIPGVYQDEEGNYVENLGDPATTRFIPASSIYPWDFARASTFDASFVKLRDISLGYSLPEVITDKIGMRDATVAIYSRNIILWTKAKNGIDPENAFQPGSSAHGQFRQGVERWNAMPWVIPVGIKLSANF